MKTKIVIFWKALTYYKLKINEVNKIVESKTLSFMVM
jgi:hypothetical protein